MDKILQVRKRETDYSVRNSQNTFQPNTIATLSYSHNSRSGPNIKRLISLTYITRDCVGVFLKRMAKVTY